MQFDPAATVKIPGQWLPILLFLAGVAMRYRAPALVRHTGLLLTMSANVGLPLVILGALSRVPLTTHDALVPVLGPVIVVLALSCSLLVGRFMGLPRPTLAAFANASGSINISFEYAFVGAAWGTQALAQLALFDVGNAIVNFTLLYVVVASVGGHRVSVWHGLRRALTFPALWALAAALTINLQQAPVPDALLAGAQQLGQWLLLPIVFAMGLLLEPRHLLSRVVLTAVAMRSVLGLVIALAFTALFAIDGLTQSVLLIAAAAPVGSSTIAIAHREHLDVGFAAATASLSALLAVFWLPLVLTVVTP